MQVSLFDGDRGVSPVIGVVLMVAITVLLAATAAVFFLNFQDQTSEGPPSTAFEVEYNANAETIGGSDSDTVTISHTSGDTVEAGTLTVVIKGTSVDGRYDYEQFKTPGGADVGAESDIKASNSIQIGADDFAGATTTDFSNAEITIVWTGGSGTRQLANEDFS